MIIRRRRTRIEIEQTTVRLEVGLSDRAPTTHGAAPTGPVLAGVLDSTPVEQIKQALNIDQPAEAATPDGKNSLSAPQEKHV